MAHIHAGSPLFNTSGSTKTQKIVDCNSWVGVYSKGGVNDVEDIATSSIRYAILFHSGDSYCFNVRGDRASTYSINSNMPITPDAAGVRGFGGASNLLISDISPDGLCSVWFTTSSGNAGGGTLGPTISNIWNDDSASGYSFVLDSPVSEPYAPGGMIFNAAVSNLQVLAGAGPMVITTGPTSLQPGANTASVLISNARIQAAFEVTGVLSLALSNVAVPTVTATASSPIVSPAPSILIAVSNVIQPFTGYSTTYATSGNVQIVQSGLFAQFVAISGATQAGATGVLYTANYTGGGTTLTLPTNPIPGQIVGLNRGASLSPLTITAPAGATLNGTAAGSVAINNVNAFEGQNMVVIATSSTSWMTLSMVGTDGGMGWTFTGLVEPKAGMTLPTGSSLIAGGGTQINGALTFGSLATLSTTQALTHNTPVLLATGTITLTLPSAAATGLGGIITIKNIHASDTVTIVPVAGTIDNAASLSLGPLASAILTTDLANWWTL